MTGAERMTTTSMPARGAEERAVRAPTSVARGRIPYRASAPRAFPRTLYALSALVWLALAGVGLPYYRLDAAHRPLSPLHAHLKPNGDAGIVYGYLGTLAILVLAAYSARKRWRFLSRLGVLRRWLNVHIFCGIAAPALITLHSSFKMHGAIALGYWAMIGVMLSGFVGYYIYSQIPRALSAGEDASEALREEVDALDTELQRRFGVQPLELRALLDAAGPQRAERMGLLSSLLFLMGQVLRIGLGWMHAGLGNTEARRLGRRDRARLRQLVQRRVGIERRQAFLRQTERLFAYWHAIHKPFAILLFVTMGLHIGIAVWLGYAWPWK